MTTTADLSIHHRLDPDPDVRPQDDLFGHVNNRWLAAVEIPEDRAVYGAFEVLREQAEQDVRAIIQECAASNPQPGSDEQKVGDLYASFMDEDAVEAAGTAPIEPLIARVQAVGGVEELVRLIGELGRQGVSGFLGAGVWIDRGQPDRYLLHIGQGGIGLPDESYYRLDEHAEIRKAYVAHLARMFLLAGATADHDTAGAMAEGIMALETRLADAHWERADTRDAVRTYNLMSAQELTERLPLAPDWLEAMGLDRQRWAQVVVGQPDVVEAVTAALREEPLGVWKHWLTARVIGAWASYLSSDLVEERFDFYGRTLTGAPQLRARWKRGVALVEGVLGEAVGRLYVERHYPPRAQEQMADLVANLIEAYRQRISTLDWMADETRRRALAKLDAFTPKIGYPAKWRDYSALQIAPDDLIGNVRRGNAFETARQIAKLSAPVDRDEWFMTPQTVNAYYNPTMNEIVFPAAILQPPFFDPDGDPAYDYGAIGAVIGHEIGHGFDDQGSRYDGDGTLRNWWTAEDRERFDAKAQALIEQYSGYSPRDLDDRHTVNGALTVGENIGDLGGVTVAHHAYRLSLGDQEPPVVEGMSGDQRFFAGWGRAWRTKARAQEAIRRLAVDPHSPPEFRANVVRNVDAFHRAFGTRPGDGMWLGPEERVSIW